MKDFAGFDPTALERAAKVNINATITLHRLFENLITVLMPQMQCCLQLGKKKQRRSTAKSF